jgi:hypothetical protein
VIRARQQLLVHYTEHVNAGRRAIRALVQSICEHIRSITVFTEWFRPATPGAIGQAPRGLAADFIQRSRYFRGIKYWNDLLEQLEAEDNGLLEELLAELKAVDEAQRRETRAAVPREGMPRSSARSGVGDVALEGNLRDRRADRFQLLADRM